MKINKERVKKELVNIFIDLMVILIAFCVVRYYNQTHFLYGTKIENISIAFLSIEKAIEEINLVKGEEIVTFCFTKDKTYDINLKQLGLRVDETRVAQIFEEQHSNPKEARQYELDGYMLVDVEMLRKFLEQIPELQEENMVEPQNAYIIWDEKEFSIQKEQLGNVIDFEEAIKFAQEKIKRDEKRVNFYHITEIFPQILTKDLVNEREELNSILNSSIHFELSDGNIVTLDSNTIKKWVYQDEKGKFKFDLENGVSEFVEELAINVNDANSYMQFLPSDSEELVTVNVPLNVRAQLDKDKEIAEIKGLLGNSELIFKKPIYDKKLISDMLSSHIEIDISRQHIWFYLDGILILHTPCVTGNVRNGHYTPIGVFFLLNKNRGVYLEGYNIDGSMYRSYVEYWMRFYPGIGMHDAPWREEFGGSIYLTNGSHGCVNMPEWAAAQTYEYIDKTIPIIVYHSAV